MKKITLSILSILALSTSWASWLCQDCCNTPCAREWPSPSENNPSNSYCNPDCSPCCKDDCNCCCSQTRPSCCSECFRWGVQFAIATGGNVAIALAGYGYYYELGALGAIKIIDGGDDTSIYTAGIFLGGRYHICPCTTFAYGIDLSSLFGEKHGRDIETSILTGPYISLEQLLTNHLLLSFWINPYFFEYEKLEKSESTRTHSIFSTGGIGLAYLF